MLIIFCLRTIDLPTPYVPSNRRRCSRCRQEVWVAKDMTFIGEIVCNRCLMPKSAKRDRDKNWKPPLFQKVDPPTE